MTKKCYHHITNGSDICKECIIKQLCAQLAACAVAAQGHKSQVVKAGDYGWSQSYQDVLNLRARVEELEEENEGLKRQRDNLVEQFLCPFHDLGQENIECTCTQVTAQIRQLQADKERLERWQHDALTFIPVDSVLRIAIDAVLAEESEESAK